LDEKQTLGNTKGGKLRFEEVRSDFAKHNPKGTILRDARSKIETQTSKKQSERRTIIIYSRRIALFAQ